MKKIEALLFDLGGVVIEIDFDHAFQTWQAISRLSIDEIRSRFKMDAAYEQHERGQIDASEYFEHLRRRLELDASDSEIASGWNAIFIGEIADTVDDIHRIKTQFPCFAFSNTNPTHQTAWMANYPRVVDAFRQIFVSSELGFRKPERAAFEAIAEATGIRLEAMLFFDDSEENINGAHAVGLKAIQVKSASDVKQALLEINAF